MFVSGSCDATVRLWDIRIASRAVRTYHGHEADVNSVKFFPDGHRFGTGSDDGTCRLFDMRTGHQLQVYSREPNRDDNELPTVTSIAFSISGRLLFAGYSNGDCYVWDTLLAEVWVFFTIFLHCKAKLMPRINTDQMTTILHCSTPVWFPSVEKMAYFHL
jgi:guanine nucleotide-binding protein G(I)/G(S)/G(T) subunit beta-1